MQRGAQNTLENYPTYLMFQGLSALVNPTWSAALGAVYLVGRIMYFRGYATGDPEKRRQGSVQYIGLLGMLGMSCKLAFDLIKASI